MSLSNVKKVHTKEEVHSVLEIARLLGDILKDPAKAKQSIQSLYDLSEEEEKKHEAARTLIGQHREILDSNAKLLEEHKASRIAFSLEQKKAETAAETQIKELGDWQRDLQAKEQQLKTKETELGKKDRELQDKATTLAVTETALNGRADKLQALEKAIAAKEKQVALQQNEIQAKQDKLKELIG